MQIERREDEVAEGVENSDINVVKRAVFSILGVFAGSSLCFLI